MKTDLDRLMAERGIDALLVAGPGVDNPTMYYLASGAGVGELTILVKKRGESPVLIVNPFEREEAAKSGLRIVERTKYDLPRLQAEERGDQLRANVRFLRAIFADLDVRGRVAIFGREEQGRALAFAEAFNGSQSEARLIGEYDHDVFEVARLTKDHEEVRRIRAVGAKTVAVVGQTAEFLSSHRAVGDVLVKGDGSPLVVGDVKRELRRWLAEIGLEDPEGVIFAVGRDAGVPHSRGEDGDPIALGKTIVFDIFPREAGGAYYYDFTRTWCVGYAPKEVEKAYGDVLDAFNAVIVETSAGEVCRLVQRRVCQLFEARGHPTIASDPRTHEGYVHSIGHGLGMNVHERPSFSDVEGNADTIPPGCVHTVEPGLYYPETGGFGIRVEDTVWMDPATGKLEILADYSKDLVLPAGNRG